MPFSVNARMANGTDFYLKHYWMFTCTSLIPSRKCIS